MFTAAAVGAALISIVLAHAWVQARRNLQRIERHVGWRLLIHPLIPVPFPDTPWICRGFGWVWKDKHTPFAQAGSDVISTVSLFPNWVTYHLADPVAIKEMFLSRVKFPKPLEHYGLLNVFGGNIISSEGAGWKRHRAAANHSFTDRNNHLVWSESVKVALQLFESDEWKDKDVVHVDHIVDVTLPMALFVLGVAAFGRPVSWNDDTIIPPGHTIPFKEAIQLVSQGLFVKLFAPFWLLKIVPRWRRVATAFEEVEMYMREMIQSRRDEGFKQERSDLFTGLLAAANSDAGDNQVSLTDDELVGNIFVFLIAGHETTAHTLAFMLGLLALYPDVQRKLHENVLEVTADGRIPTYEDISKLGYAMAVLNESMRLYPPALQILKKAEEDTSLPIAAPLEGDVPSRKRIVVPKGAYIYLIMPGLHYNEKYWERPYHFDPERFLRPDWPRDAFVPFSGGARSCIGRRFFEAEAIALMTMVVSRYEVELDPSHAAKWEHIADVDERRDLVLEPFVRLTLAPRRLPLVFKRRV